MSGKEGTLLPSMSGPIMRPMQPWHVLASLKGTCACAGVCQTRPDSFAMLTCRAYRQDNTCSCGLLPASPKSSSLPCWGGREKKEKSHLWSPSPDNSAIVCARAAEHGGPTIPCPALRLVGGSSVCLLPPSRSPAVLLNCAKTFFVRKLFVYAFSHRFISQSTATQ